MDSNDRDVFGKLYAMVLVIYMIEIVRVGAWLGSLWQ